MDRVWSDQLIWADRVKARKFTYAKRIPYTNI